MVQEPAMKVWQGDENFKDLILKDERVRKYMTEKEIEEIFDVNYHLKHVDTIFERVFTREI